ncbi:MAG: T9SS type A sorting domain-containing protein [Candidatus Electryonea clarkiae]|nr:T9SS type A sorting domain-containing protein [Candidatus Electryonea clarkiae]MDP8287055.1 T9SS type A sorting domain-containing protein [Candidatus Electryonea clarkiae]
MLAYFPLLKRYRLIGTLFIALIIVTPIYAQYELSGSLSGVIETGDYYVLDSIRVNSRDSLIIEQGTTIFFCENAEFNIYGSCRAVGEPGDSINFIAEDSLYGWSGIKVSPMHGSIIDFRYCTLRHTNIAAIKQIFLSESIIQNCRFSYNTGFTLTFAGCGISDRYPLKNCVFSNNDNFVIANAFFITIDSCSFVNNRGIIRSGVGYVGMSNCLIINNITHRDRGLIDGDGDLMIIHNNLFINNDLNGSSILNYGFSSDNQSSFYNNTIINNYAGNYCLNILRDANLVVENNIFYNNDVNYDINVEDSLSSIAYNLFNKDDGSYFTGNYIDNGLGVVDTINANEDSSDIYSNLFLNAEFEIIDSTFVELQSYSPCIDAGNPLSPFDPDSTIADIGYKFFSQNHVKQKDTFKLPLKHDILSIYPNPSNSSVKIQISNLYNMNNNHKIKVYNILGELVKSININSSIITINNTNNLTSGIYVIRLIGNNLIIDEAQFFLIK